MARARNIKPGFFKNEDLAECTFEARLCFAGLWTLADREGRLEDRPKRIKGELFAYDSVEVEPLLRQLSARNFILRYKDGSGLGLIQILEFKKHQSPHHKELKSVLASPQSLGLLIEHDDAKASGFDPVDDDECPRLKDDERAMEGPPTALNPDTGLLIPDSLNPKKGAHQPATTSRALAEGEVDPPEPAPGSGTAYGLAALAMRQQGMSGANPGDPRLRALVDAGCSLEELQAAAREAVDKGKTFPWAITALANRRQEAATKAAAMPQGAQRVGQPPTVTHNPDVDTTRQRLEAEAQRTVTAPSAEARERMARIKADRVLAANGAHHPGDDA